MMQYLKIWLIISFAFSSPFLTAAAAAEEKAADFIIDSGFCSIPGTRPQEDRYVHNPAQGIFAVFDGHHGPEIAEYAAHNLIKTFDSNPADSAHSYKLRIAFQAIEEHAKISYEQGRLKKSGTTAVAAALRCNQLTIANTGDSRAMLFRKNKGTGKYEVALETADHKPEGKELDRIQLLGAYAVDRSGGKYVGNEFASHGLLAYTRALGHIDLKTKLGAHGFEILKPTPDIYQEEIQDDDTLILGSDGLWDMYDHYKKYNAHELFNRVITDTTKCAALRAQHIVTEVEAIEKRSGHASATDNTTAIVVHFKPLRPKKAQEEIIWSV